MGDSELWLAIYDLYELLTDKVNEERAYQSYFENHPIVFSVLGYDAAVPFDKGSHHKLPHDNDRNFRPEPDFICGIRQTGEVTVFELKTPFQSSPTTSRSDGNREKFKANVESYLAQASEYVNTIRGREAARAIVCEALQLPGISSYKIAIIYGRSDAEDALSVARLTDMRLPDTEIIPYDVLLDRLIDCYAISRRDTNSREGWCFCCHIVVAPNQIHPRAYNYDIGTPGHNRVSMYIEKEDLVLRCIDKSGESHKSAYRCVVNEPLYVRFEFSTDEGGILISYNVNNEEVDLRVGQKPLEVAPDITSFFLGSDLNESRNARFKLLEYYIVGKTMDLKCRLDSFRYFKHKIDQSGNCLEFDGTSYMIRKTDGAMVTTENDNRPILRDTYTYF